MIQTSYVSAYETKGLDVFNGPELGITVKEITIQSVSFEFYEDGVGVDRIPRYRQTNTKSMTYKSYVP